jgi:Protein of unknown function (DUF3375).
MSFEMSAELDYHEIRYRLDNYAVFTILRKDNAAFMLGFLHDQFKGRHKADIGQAELVRALEAFQEFVRISEGELFAPRPPQAYLDEWANDGFLRKYYPADATEACYDLTPDSELALEWIGELSRRPFVGAESRLIALFDALRDLVYGAAYDPEEKRAELERRRAEIDAELGRIERGETGRFDETKILERYYGAEDAARRLLADFKQIEQNFRDLDRETKERVIASDRSRGSVLKEVFEHRDAIVTSDQGKSFSSFWSFLMSLDKREELADLVDRVLSIPAVRASSKTFPLDSLDSRLVGAGARVQDMTYRLNEELRRFLDERSRREGLRVGELVEAWKRLTLECRDDPPSDRDFLTIDGDPELGLAMDRPLYAPEAAVVIAQRPQGAGNPSVGVDALYDIDSVDLGALAGRISALLAASSQASLSEVVSRFPVVQGAAEVLGYLSLAAGAGSAASWGSREQRAEIQARNEKRGAKLVIDSPDPAFLAEVGS